LLKKILLSLTFALAAASAQANIITGSAVLTAASLSGAANPIPQPINISWQFSTLGTSLQLVSVDAFSLVLGNDVFNASNTTWTQFPYSNTLQSVDIRGSGSSVVLFSAQIYTGGPNSNSGLYLFYAVPQDPTLTFRASAPTMESLTPSPVPLPSSLLLAMIGALGFLGISRKTNRA
jgi:PEP-CTERM motif